MEKNDEKKVVKQELEDKDLEQATGGGYWIGDFFKAVVTGDTETLKDMFCYKNKK